MSWKIPPIQAANAGLIASGDHIVYPLSTEALAVDDLVIFDGATASSNVPGNDEYYGNQVSKTAPTTVGPEHRFGQYGIVKKAVGAADKRTQVYTHAARLSVTDAALASIAAGSFIKVGLDGALAPVDGTSGEKVVGMALSAFNGSGVGFMEFNGIEGYGNDGPTAP